MRAVVEYEIMNFEFWILDEIKGAEL